MIDMMRHDIVARLLEEGALAVVRMADADGLLRVVEALRMGGLSAIEITMTTTDAFRVIERVSTEAPGALVGVGSVLDGETARRAIDAGARYVVSPILDAEVIATAHRYDVPALPGAFTPTEIQHAHTLGADVVKVFPASHVGTSCFRALCAPMPHLKLMPTGGVTLTNAGDWLRSGACAVGVGSALLDRQAIAEKNYHQITENARTLRDRLVEAREELASDPAGTN